MTQIKQPPENPGRFRYLADTLKVTLNFPGRKAPHPDLCGVQAHYKLLFFRPIWSLADPCGKSNGAGDGTAKIFYEIDKMK